METKEDRKRRLVEKNARLVQGVRVTTSKERKAFQGLGMPLILPARLVLPDIPSIAAELMFVDNPSCDECIDTDPSGDVACSIVRFTQLPDDLKIKLWGPYADREQYRYVFVTIHEALEALYQALPSSVAMPRQPTKLLKISKKVNGWTQFWVEHNLAEEKGDGEGIIVCSPISCFLKAKGGAGMINHPRYISKHPVSQKLPDFRNNLLEMGRLIYTKNGTKLKDWPHTYRATDPTTTTKEIEDDIAKALEAQRREEQEEEEELQQQQQETTGMSLSLSLSLSPSDEKKQQQESKRQDEIPQLYKKAWEINPMPLNMATDRGSYMDQSQSATSIPSPAPSTMDHSLFAQGFSLGY